MIYTIDFLCLLFHSFYYNIFVCLSEYYKLWIQQQTPAKVPAFVQVV